MADQFQHMGYAVICDNCDRRTQLPSADTDQQAFADAESKGFVKAANGKWYCNDDCRREAAGEICIHVLARSGPDSKACIKCGTPREQLAWDRRSNRWMS